MGSVRDVHRGRRSPATVLSSARDGTGGLDLERRRK